jgi:hypothetical protein
MSIAASPSSVGGGGQENAGGGGGIETETFQRQRHQRAADAAGNTAADQRDPDYDAQQHGVRVVLVGGDDEHAQRRHQSGKGAVERTQRCFLGHQRAFGSGLQFAQRHPAQGHRQRLAAGVAGLSREYRQEQREDHQPVDGVLENRHHRAGNEGRQQVDLQPGMAEPEAAFQRCRQPFLLLDTDHAADLRRDLEGLFGEHGLAAHQAQQAALAVADRIDRVMAVEHQFHRIGQLQVRRQHEGIAQHDRFQRRAVVGKQQVTHGDDAEQPAGFVDDVTVGDECRAHQRPQLFDGLAHQHLRPEHRAHRLHHPADAAVGELLVGTPLGDGLLRRRMDNAVDEAAGQLGQHILGQRRGQVLQHFGDQRRRIFGEQLGGLSGRSGLGGQHQSAAIRFLRILLFLRHRLSLDVAGAAAPPGV